MMGLCVSGGFAASSPAESPQKNKRQKKAAKSAQLMRGTGVGMGVAMMMQQAAQLSGAAQYAAMGHPPVDLFAIKNDVRRAKAEGRTVTVINECVYVDYQLVAQLPPGCQLPY